MLSFLDSFYGCICCLIGVLFIFVSNSKFFNKFCKWCVLNKFFLMVCCCVFFCVIFVICSWLIMFVKGVFNLWVVLLVNVFFFLIVFLSLVNNWFWLLIRGVIFCRLCFNWIGFKLFGEWLVMVFFSCWSGFNFFFKVN